ncbi:C2 domain-containing protein [Sergentomyia squamirostris]
MPGKVKVKVLAGRNLPVMDRSSDTTDAFVELKLGGITHKTDVCRKSLNPQWNSDWYRFEMDDAELQDEPLQIRLMDYDTYSANDAIGKVHICLNPLLIPGAVIDPSGQTGHGHGKGSIMSGWFPVFDTMHGIRGEVNLIVKVDLFSDVNKFRQSSCGVQFFHSPNIPHGYHAPAIHGFVEELVVNDDPEYQWIDKIRTPRASNEARQVVFLKLSGEVQRKIGLKALDMGANAVIGYKLCLDLEGDVGVVARGIGTAVTLIKIPDAPPLQVADTALIEERTLRYLEFLNCTPSPSHLRDSISFESPQVSRFSSFNYLPVMRNESDDYLKASEIDEKLLNRLTQEDHRGKMSSGSGRLAKKLKTIHTLQANALGRRILAKAPEFGLTSAPRTTLNAPKLEIDGQSPNAWRSRRRRQFQRSSSEGAAMTSLLVASLMSGQTMGLDRISESHDSHASSQDSKKLSESADICHSIDTLCMSQSSKTSLFPSFESDSLSSDDEASDSTPERVEICFDSDTVSMVMRNVQEKGGNDNATWIEPKISHHPEEDVKVGSSRIVSGMKNETILVESESVSREETLHEILKGCNECQDARDDESWIKPGSTIEEPDYEPEKKRSKSFFTKFSFFKRASMSRKRSKFLDMFKMSPKKVPVKKAPPKPIEKPKNLRKPEIRLKPSSPRENVPFMSLFELVEKDDTHSTKSVPQDRHNSLPVTLTSNVEQSSMASNKHSNLSHTNQMLLAPSPFSYRARHEAGGSSSATNGATPASPGAKTSSSGHIRTESTGSRMNQSPAKTATTSAVPCKDSGIYRRSSDSDLSVTPKGNSLTSCERGTPAVTRVVGVTMKNANTDNLDMLEYPFLTLDKYPPGFIIHLGSAVCSRSVKLLERVPNPDEPETRDSWWTELRMEIRSHARALGCNVVLGYSETTAITEDVCVLSATGTAALINFPYSSEQPVRMTSSLDRGEFEKDVKEGIKELKIAGSATKIIEGVITKPIEEVPEVTNEKDTSGSSLPGPSTLVACSLLHLPYSPNSVPFSVSLDNCAICKRAKVPNVFLATIEIPETLQITGRGCLVQAQVCRQKRDLKGESNAKEISDGLPFLEYELYRVLINKMKVKGMNAIFGLKCSIAVGEKMMTIVATGTAVYLSALPPAVCPKIIEAGQSWSNPEKLNEIQRSLQDTIEKNREIYQLKSFGDVEPRPLSESEESDDELADMDLTVGNKDACILEVDDIDDLEVISLLMEPCPPEGFHVVNTQTVPGLLDLEVVRNLQYFAQVWRGHISQQTHLAKNLQRLLQCIYYKLRSMIPCAICDLRFTVDLPEADLIQVLVTGMALGLGEPTKLIKTKRRLLSASTSRDGFKKGEDELIFNLEEDHVFDTVTPGPSGTSQSVTPTPTSHNPPTQFAQTGSLKLRSKSPTKGKAPANKLPRHMPLRERYGVDVTPLSYVPGGRIEKYLGNLNFFFIRESTSIRENGGICGFVHGFVTELLAVVRAHVTALGGNAIVSFYMTELLLNESIHKNQGQSLISVGGDVVFVSYYADD